MLFCFPATISLTFNGAQLYIGKQNVLLKYTFVYSVCLYMHMYVHTDSTHYLFHQHLLL